MSLVWGLSLLWVSDLARAGDVGLGRGSLVGVVPGELSGDLGYNVQPISQTSRPTRRLGRARDWHRRQPEWEQVGERRQPHSTERNVLGEVDGYDELPAASLAESTLAGAGESSVLASLGAAPSAGSSHLRFRTGSTLMIAGSRLGGLS